MIETKLQWYTSKEKIPELKKSVLFISDSNYIHFGYVIECEGCDDKYYFCDEDAEEGIGESEISFWCYAPELIGENNEQK